MARRMALLLLTALFLSGCVSSSPAGGSASTASSSPRGSYVAGQSIVLANGARLTVPSGWRAELLTDGALVTRAPASSGIVGVTMEVTGTPHWGTLVISVFGSGTLFDDAIAAARSATAKPAPGAVTTQVPLVAGDEASTTAFVTVWSTVPLRHELSIFVQPRLRDPMELDFELSRLPPQLGSLPPARLPESMLGYIQFKPR